MWLSAILRGWKFGLAKGLEVVDRVAKRRLVRCGCGTQRGVPSYVWDRVSDAVHHRNSHKNMRRESCRYRGHHPVRIGAEAGRSLRSVRLVDVSAVGNGGQG